MRRLWVLGLCVAAWAQDEKPPVVKPVEMSVLVMDVKGAPVTGLSAADFDLKVAGDAQTVMAVRPVTAQPMVLGIVADVGRAQKETTGDVIKATQDLLDHALAAKDKAYVIQFAKEIELLTDATDAHPALAKAVRQLGTDSPYFHASQPASDTTDSEGRKVRRGGTSLIDALYLATTEVAAKQAGRRLIVLFSDGIDAGSKESLTDTIDELQRANVTVFAVYSKGEEQRENWREANGDQSQGQRRSGSYPGGGGGYPGGGGGGYPGGGGGGGQRRGGGPEDPSRRPHIDGKQALERLCGETGGRVIALSKKVTVADAFAEIATDVNAGYLVSFTPTGAAARSGTRKVDLGLKGEAGKKKPEIDVRSSVVVVTE